MQTNTRLLILSMLVSTALCLTVSAAQARSTVTRININGKFATVFLVDVGFNGSLTASKDQVAGTSALDFSYGYADPANPDQIILINGAGQIPNDAFTITSSTAHLNVTVSDSPSFPLQRCIVNQNLGTVDCVPSSPSSFDLTWAADGFSTVDETTDRPVRNLWPIYYTLQG